MSPSRRSSQSSSFCKGYVFTDLLLLVWVSAAQSAMSWGGGTQHVEVLRFESLGSATLSVPEPGADKDGCELNISFSLSSGVAEVVLGLVSQETYYSLT